jgi:hypothetical protein
MAASAATGAPVTAVPVTVAAPMIMAVSAAVASARPEMVHKKTYPKDKYKI